MRSFLFCALLPCVAAGPASKPAQPGKPATPPAGESVHVVEKNFGGFATGFGAGAGPASKPALKPTAPAAAQPASPAPPTSKPSATQPARVDPAFVADFNQKLINSKFDDVIARLRETGAIFSGPWEMGKDTRRAAGTLTSYQVRLGYAWEFGTYRFRVDAKGLIQQYEFDTKTDADRNFAQRLNAGNRWYWVQYRIGRSATGEDADAVRIQARTAAAAEAQVIANYEMLFKREYEVRNQERPAWAKLTDVKAFDWFAPRYPSSRSGRPTEAKQIPYLDRTALHNKPTAGATQGEPDQ